MPLTNLQQGIAKILKPFRNEGSYVAGGAALNQTWLRLSDDMDIFDDGGVKLPDKVQPELKALRQAGYHLEITTNDAWMVEAIVRKYNFETRVQWLDDPETCRRYFPAIADEELGFRLHQADAAVNKVLCSSRRESAARDAVDLLTIVRNYAPLGPLVWACVGKDPNTAPPHLISEIRRIAFSYPDEEIRAVRVNTDESITREELVEDLDTALEKAADYCMEVAPETHIGRLFVDEQEIPVCADEDAITGGLATAIQIRDFSGIPKLID